MKKLLFILFILPACNYMEVASITDVNEPWGILWERVEGMESRPLDDLMLLTKDQVLWYRVVQKKITRIDPQVQLKWGKIYIENSFDGIPFFMPGSEELYFVMCSPCEVKDTVRFIAKR